MLATAGALVLSLTGVIDEPKALAASSSEATKGAAASVAEMSSAAEAFATAKRQKSRVEIAEERTAFSSTFALPSGERETEFGDFLRVKRGGQWYAFDSVLTTTRGDVRLPVVKFGRTLPRVDQRAGAPGPRSVLLPGAAVADLTGRQMIPARLVEVLAAERRARKRAGSRFGDAPVFSPRVSAVPIRIARGGAESEETTPLGEIETTQGASIALYWPEDLPRAQVQGREASYDLGGDEELRVTAEARGFNAHVVLDERPDLSGGAPVYRFPVEVDGVRLIRTQDTGYAALDAEGRSVFRIEPTVAWDSSPLPADADEQPTVLVESEMVTDADGRTVLEVRPSVDWFARAQCPCFVDPNFSYTAAPVYDTVVREGTPTQSYGSSAAVQAGTKDATTLRQRAYIEFNTGIIANKQVASATLQLRQSTANTCTATAASVYPITNFWNESSTWNTRPVHNTSATYKVTKSFAHGFTGCADAYESFNVTTMVRAFVNGTLQDNGFAVLADNETSTGHFKAFCAFNVSTTTGCNQAAWTPKLTVIYNTRPAYVNDSGIEPARACEYLDPPFVNTTRPFVTGTPRDPDLDRVKLDVEVYPVTSTGSRGPGPTVAGATGFLPSGALQRWQVPGSVLTDGQTYEAQVRGNDGADVGVLWSNACRFTVDITKPNAPSVSSTAYPAGQWSGAANTAGTFTITPGTDPAPSGGAASGASGVMWSLDDPTPTETLELNGSGGIDPITVTPKTDGKHILYVATVDKAGNLSAAATYEFFVGHGALTSPDEGDRTARRFFLTAQVQDAAAVTFQWRRGETDSWHDVVGGFAVPAVAGQTISLNWDAGSAVGEDGKVDLRVLLIGGGADGQGSFPISVTIDRLGSGAATTQIGPGTVNLLTGDYALSATDVSFWGISVARTARSRDPHIGEHVTGLVAPFGPQWVAGGVAEFAGARFTSLTRTTLESVELVRSDATKVQFTLTTDQTASGDPLWQPEVGAEDLALVGDDGSFTLTATDGTVVRFVPSGAPGLSTVNSATPPGAGNLARYRFGSDGAGKLRLDRIVAPNASIGDLADCDVDGPPPVGCRRLDLTYADGSVPPPAGSALGDYPGRASGVRLWVTDPVTGVVADQQVAAYAYDNAGRLREVWDPRIGPPHSEFLKVAYSYDDDGRVTSVTPPGELGLNFRYGTAGTDTNSGRLLSVARAALDDGRSETLWNVVYDVPLTPSADDSSNGPHDMGASVVGTWGQTATPTDATAILPPDADFDPSDSHTGGRGDWTRATINYLDIEGRQLNQAIPGGGIATVEYDEFGNVVRELSIKNRERALRAATDPEIIGLGLALLPTAQRADMLATLSIYDDTGQRLVEQYGPVRAVVLPDSPSALGQPALAREHTSNLYDQGRPTDGSARIANQITETKIGARVIGTDGDVDVRTTTTAYDWAAGNATSVTQNNGSTAITTITAYDSQGRPIRVDMPSAVDNSRTNGADSTYTTYYSDAAAAPCNSKVLDGLVCETRPGGAISGGGSNPAQRVTTRTTYTVLGLVRQVTETANSVSRTTTTDYDAAGRATLVTVAGGLGTAVPSVATTYSPTTGRVIATVDTSVTPNSSILRTYDALGRPTSYTDTDGGKTETTYTWLDQVASVNQYSNPANPTVPIVTTYGYSTDRQRLTTMVDALAGSYTATYDTAGQLVSQTMPGGVTMTQMDDPTGVSWVTRTYTGNTGVLLTETVLPNIHGQWRTRVRGDNLTYGTNQRYAYDSLGRLVQTLDTTGTVAGPKCVRRDYGFAGDPGLNTNRTAFAQNTSPNETCLASAGSAVTSTYDTADRITNAGYVYDAYGRTTSAPLPAGTATLEYHANDIVRRQTLGTGRQTWTLDPGMRFRGWTTESKPSTTWNLTGAKTNHYASDSDSPAWINETATGVTRNVSDINGDISAYTDAATANVFWLQLITLHGDVGQVIHYVNSTTSDGAYSLDNDEYGARKPGTITPAYGRYAWLGGKQRSMETVSNSLALMGARLYNPASGRFLQVDPVSGGNRNDYDYVGQDPCNSSDLSGFVSRGKATKCDWSQRKRNRWYADHLSSVWIPPTEWGNGVNTNIASTIVEIIDFVENTHDLLNGKIGWLKWVAKGVFSIWITRIEWRYQYRVTLYRMCNSLGYLESRWFRDQTFYQQRLRVKVGPLSKWVNTVWFSAPF